ncbi:MAG: site-specific DNA-methyltransferase [Candidatus Accumulibacter sp.]|jgi:DNA modification methylase|nr:site-specific DNA-methyltransferase [Accumulibacter sp.]
MQRNLFPEEYGGAQYSLVCDDALHFLKTVGKESVQLVITSPPYNIGKSYENKVPIQDYLSAQKSVIAEIVRTLNPRGSICWQVGNYVDGGEVYPLDIFYYDLFKSFGLKLRNRIIWHFGHGLHAKNRLSGRYETLLWFTKTNDYVFNLDAIRVPSKYPNKRHFKGDKKGELSGNPHGKNPSDFWEFLKNEWEGGIFEIPNVKSNHPEKTFHPCQYPVELAERCVLAFTNENDVVLDPYAGVASSLIAAIMHNRTAMGVDRCREYIDTGRERLNSLVMGSLKTRPLGKPVHEPSGKEKIAQIPLEWRLKKGVYG